MKYLKYIIITYLLLLRLNGLWAQSASADSVLMQKLGHYPANLSGFRAKNGGVKAELKGVYIQDHKLYFRLQVSNHSPLSYDLSFVRFAIAGPRRTARTAYQEEPLSPENAQAYQRLSVPSAGYASLIYAIPQFTIGPHKQLIIALGEKHGDRQLRIAAGGKLLEHALIIH